MALLAVLVLLQLLVLLPAVVLSHLALQILHPTALHRVVLGLPPPVLQQVVWTLA